MARMIDTAAAAPRGQRPPDVEGRLTDVARTQAELTALRRERDYTVAAVNALDSRVADLDAEIEAMTVDQERGEKIGERARVAGLRAKRASRVGQIEEEIARREGARQVFCTEIADLEERVAEIRRERAAAVRAAEQARLEAEVAQAEAELAALQARSTVAVPTEAEVRAYEKVVALQRKVTTAPSESELAGIAAQVPKVEGRLSELRGKLAGLTGGKAGR